MSKRSSLTRFRRSDIVSGLLFLAVVLPSFLGPVIGIISDRYGRKWLATSGFLLAIPVEVLFRLVTHSSLSQKVLLVVLLALLGLSMSLIVTPITAELTLVAERLQRTGKLGNKGAYAQVGAVRYESIKGADVTRHTVFLISLLQLGVVSDRSGVVLLPIRLDGAP
jgi:MFS family permease